MTILHLYYYLYRKKQISVAVLCCIALFVYACQPAQAQTQTIADTLELEEVEVVATRIDQPMKYQPTAVEVIDSTRLSLLHAQSIGDILASQSSLFIKNNGPGGMATASQRGLSSEQIQVLWEGIPINSPTIGQTDLSLLPTSFFSNIQVSSGTPSTAFGGGSLSGALYLSSDWEESRHFSARQCGGSFGQWQSSLQGGYTTEDLQVSIRGLYDYAENDFEYYNRGYDRVEKRQHNRSERYNMMASVGEKTGAGEWKSVFWAADSDNQIPGNILNTNSRARQEDQAVRWLSTYRHSWGDTELELKNFLGRSALNYFDRGINTRSFTTTRRWLISSNIKHTLSEYVELKGELSGELTGVETNNYNSLKTRQQFSALTNPEVTFFDRRLRLYPALRLDVYSDFGTVLSPSLGVNYELLTNRLFVRGQLSRDFNPPTFNALYWGQGGNPDLKAERSNSAEAGVTLTPRRFLGLSSVKLTGYYSEIDHGIRWFPGNDGIYIPSNVEQLTTQGIEAYIKNSFLMPGNWHLQLDQSGSLNRTEITEPRFDGDAAVGHQVRYVPQWKYKASLSVDKGIARVLLQYRWVGRRYTTDTEDFSSSLDPYQVLDATLQLRRRYGDITFKARAGIKNLLDRNYEIIQWYAMPQRNVTFSLTATYQL
ncbi:Outer membrane cobalamin receptor protein [Fodinibius roseus]|uniref:Outer membrane cobalamin receptor protein n=1 Tax=Fodinibius roseus TaxID=1194090 RepID=A0A1M4T3L4_9BACT|nr:TonB-dependent receptor [Fodinibius roseus]SHE39066.1 Outer membrane cobalamin receptor protein [Fodinibius roseus]